jgi:hypothetical protein
MSRQRGHTKESKLERARTAIRNFVADHLKTRDEKDAALVAFVSPSEKQWRFSYVKMEYATVEKESGKIGVETRLTPARRFSYIVGEGESCHTAQTRFLNLLENTESDPTLAGIEEAFSVEAVTEEFFRKYAELFGNIQKALDRNIVICNERHLRRVLSSYADYYHRSRTHLSLDKDCPDPRPVTPPGVGRVVAIPQVNGLHHRYERLAA